MIGKSKIRLLSIFAFFILLVCPAISYVNANAGTMKNDPGGFADLYWGESLNEVTSSHQTKYLGNNHGSEQYAVSIKNANGCMYLRGPVLVFAVFFNQKLGAIRIPIFGGYSAMISPLEQLYGTPEFKNGLFTWEGQNTDMIFTATNVQKNDGIIYLVSNKLRK
ncbi:hypothetical protein [Megasphaera hominis]|uniref:Uncharacterized protein n=1 Tax=Megasphaera hominis TaxID=159836 RepID=A0ABR6VER8_9FIRM|nr:hypothetical protein [Megasphaera hominis]MBC3535728.1 hypothetical protein [Megasphaera hominis]